MTAKAAPGIKLESESPQALLWWLVFLRVVVSVFILGATFLIDQHFHVAVFTLVVFNVLITLAFALLIPTFGDRRFFISMIVYWDLLFVALLMSTTGISRSIFIFLFLLSVVNAGILLTRREAFFAAALALLCYTGVLSIEVFKLRSIPLFGMVRIHSPGMTPAQMIPDVALRFVALFIAAFLSSYVSEQSRSRQSKLLRAQHEMEQLRTLYENIVASVPIGILAIDPQGKVAFASRIAARILGRPSEEIVGQGIDSLLFHRAGEGSGSEPSQTMAEQRRRLVLARRGEDPLHLQIFNSELRNKDGLQIGRIVLIEDQSAIHKMEEEIKRSDKLAAVGKMAAGIAHEIRNPLASISGSIQLLKGDLALDDLNGNLMDIVVRETDRLNKLISDFLAFARPAKIAEEIVDLNLLLDETIELCQNDPDYSDSIKFKRGFSKGAYLKADGNQLRQLFWNLFVNSIQAMSNGGEIEVVTTLLGRAGDADPLPKEVEIKISDSGVGIPKELLPQIFDPFFTTKESGTGLGLTTAYRIVENHNGRITVESQPGLGTSFYITLPMG